MDAPPDTPARETSYELHGEEIEDPYLWLEDESDEVDAWVDRQNEYADAYLENVPVRESLRPTFESAARRTEYGTIVARPTGYYQEVKRPTDDHARLTHRDSLAAKREVLLDPNEWSEDGTTSMGWWTLDPEGAYLAYAVDEGGEEQFDLCIRDLSAGELVTTLTDLGRAGEPAWTDSGLYYTETGPAETGDQLEKAVRFHEFGTEQADDPVIHEVTDPGTWPAVMTDRSGEHLLVHESIGWERSALYYAPAGARAVEPVLTECDSWFQPLFRHGRVYFRTNHEADRYRLLSCPSDRISTSLDPDEMQEIVPEGDGILKQVVATDDSLVTGSETAAVAEVDVYGRDGTHRGSIELPEIGSVTGLSGNRDGNEAFFVFETFGHPPTVYRTDPTARSLTELDREAVPMDVSVTIDQEWTTAPDGTDVPLFVVYRSDISLQTPAPTLLYGYGGYEISLTPSFDPFRQPFLQAGGVYVQANLRGGGEFGKEWHRAARHDRKQHTFDDMIAVAEHLIDTGYTDSDHLAIRGGSNGGLTVGAVMTQRPDLVDTVVCEVPLLDMLRFHRFLLGDSWTTEYGSPDDQEAFEWIRAYSPYHNLQQRAYPAVLFKTAEGDTRVHPVHAWKMAARMQRLDTGDRPTLCKTNRDTGHGTGKPTWMVVEEALDVWSFLFDQLGVESEG